MASRRYAFLTMAATDGWQIDSDLAIPPLRSLGWSVDVIEWRRSGVNWEIFDGVYIGTPWDYPEDPHRFIETLEEIERAGPCLVNSLELVRWNLHKSYLRDLEARGVAVVPTRWYDKFDLQQVSGEFDRFESGEIVIKPVISTNAGSTYRLDRGKLRRQSGELASEFGNREFMVQPFLSSIVSEGELSMFFIDGELSHVIRKTPRQGDYRVQEERGASLSLVVPDASLRQAAVNVMSSLPAVPVYARCDLVKSRGRYLLMELELIEPSMYLRMESGAPERFAQSLHRAVD